MEEISGLGFLKSIPTLGRWCSGIACCTLAKDNAGQIINDNNSSQAGIHTHSSVLINWGWNYFTMRMGIRLITRGQRDSAP